MATPKLQEAVVNGKVVPAAAPSAQPASVVHWTLEVRVNPINMA